MKTVKSSLRRTIILILCVSFFVLYCSLYFSIGSIYREREGENLTNTTQRLCKIAAGVMGKTNVEDLPYNYLLEKVYEEDVETFSRNTGYYVLTVDKYDRVIFASSNVEPFINKKGVPQKQIASVLQGNPLECTSDLSFFYGEKVITSAQPVFSEGEVIGAVICSLPTDYLSKLRLGTMGSVLLVLGPMLIICLIVTYYVAERITRPISYISCAAKLIAEGDLSKRVELKNYENEIGELAVTFNEMATALENSDKMKNSFISDVSHELKTPMTSIIGFLQGMRDGVIPPQQFEKYINICLEESKRLSRLVNRLLDIARLEAGENEIERVSFDVNEKIRNTVFRFEEAITEKKLVFRADFYDDELYVFADADGIERVITNLIDNAVKFTPVGGKVFINTRKNGEKAHISISNSGEGIALSDIDGIWDKFYKGDKSRSNDRFGTGLGLFFVKKILNNHGERITVTCEEKPAERTKYTIFNFELKLTEKESIQYGSKN